MATDLSEILADLRRLAKEAPKEDPAAAADARIALSRLRPALQRLRDEGISPSTSTVDDPDAFERQADRVHWVDLLAGACDRLGAATPVSVQPGRLTRLSDAAAVTATLDSDTLTTNQRWTIVAALSRTAHHLSSAAGGGAESAEIARAVIVAEASSNVLFQFASVDLTTPADVAVLRRPVPNPYSRPASAGDAAVEETVALAHAVRPGTGPHSIADILAVATAARTVCSKIADADSLAADRSFKASAEEAAAAWGDVRSALAPFNDGSRRPQRILPPPVAHALALHRNFSTDTPRSRGGQDGSSPPQQVLRRLSAVAQHLDQAVVDSVRRGAYMAFAADLPFRESRARPFLQARHARGLVTVDINDVGAVRAALSRAGRSTARVAEGVSVGVSPTISVGTGPTARKAIADARRSLKATDANERLTSSGGGADGAPARPGSQRQHGLRR